MGQWADYKWTGYNAFEAQPFCEHLEQYLDDRGYCAMRQVSRKFRSVTMTVDGISRRYDRKDAKLGPMEKRLAKLLRDVNRDTTELLVTNIYCSFFLYNIRGQPHCGIV